MSDPTQFHQQVKLLLDHITESPADLSLYKQLRDTSLRYKAAGGCDLGVIEKLKLKMPAKDPLQRLVDALRLWSFDPGNTDHAVSVLQALENYSHQFPEANIASTRRWLVQILKRMNLDSRR